MIITWTCELCGWNNDNNPGACRKCGGGAKVKNSVASKEAERGNARLETCTGCGIRIGHTISCPVAAGAPDDKRLRALWRAHGGSFHGPNIETGTMPESILLPFLRGLHATQEGQPK